MSRLFICFILIPIGAFADALTGVVRAPNGQPLAGATVRIERRSTTTDAEGRFGFELPAGTYAVRVSRDGFQSQTLEATAGTTLELTLRPALAESIVVSGIRADEKTPVTKTDLTRAEIETRYYGQDIPLLLRDTPSINSYAEGGVGGAGYSYAALRGISPTRINFTLDGVPLADSEDMGTYFVDFPDLAHSLESIQVQRGVGTSTVGSPSFGGSINLESVALSSTPSTDVRLGGGSFGTKLGTVGYQSGDLPGGFVLYGRLSAQETNGFREHSGVRQHNLFLSLAKQNEDSQLKLTGFAGHEYQQNSYFATDADTLKSDLRFNPMSPEERDSFGYNLAQLQYLRSNMTASVFFQRGYGWYRLYDDESAKSGLRQYGLDGLLMGGMLTLSSARGPFSANYGVHLNEFRREHTRDLVGGPRDYYNYGTKSEANAFAKFFYDVARWHLYSDAQLRTTDFHYHGDVTIDPIRWMFFNPKLGARYDLSARSGLYASAGMSTREPTRNDLFQGEDNASFAHDLHAVRPERLVDIEAGFDYRGRRASIAANVYAMNFHHEIAATGELSAIGLPLRRNVDRSYRRGIELDAVWQATPALRLHTTTNLSRNRIHSWTQFYGSQPIVYLNVNPLLTPTLIVNQSVDYAPASRASVGATARYVSKSFLDNTNSEAFTTPSFFTLDGNLAVGVRRSAKLVLQINNILNNKRVFPSGYSYLFLTPTGAVDGVRYYYPQATRSAVASVDWKL
jgi:iron complex outermembrane receptor protein